MRLQAFAGLIALLAAAPVDARAPATAADLKRIETDVPRQDWYPDGYYDVRIAAEAELAEEPAAKEDLAPDWGDGAQYDILGCGGFFIMPEDADDTTRRYGNAALEIARMRRDLRTIGYPAEVYAAPLAAYERHLVEQARRRTPDEILIALGIGSDEIYDALPEAEEETEVGDPPEAALARSIEANRARVARHLPQVVAEGGCGDAPPAPVIVRTEPPGGEVLLISAFAFKVCTRKLTDPWDRFACRWKEIETDKPTEIRGRNAYQVRWPDGDVRRGVREFDLNYNDDTPTTATFRKTGS
jgi:hypothetical protein